MNKKCIIEPGENIFKAYNMYNRESRKIKTIKK